MTVYCGGRRRHEGSRCPPNALLDEPYPSNLPVVEVCLGYNQFFSMDA